MNRQTNRPSRAARRQSRRRPIQPQPLPYTGRNWRLFWIGLGAIVLGYITLGMPPVNGFMTMTVAPLLLVAGYCVIIPLALLAGEKKKDEGERIKDESQQP
jgi:hypothetical protein